MIKYEVTAPDFLENLAEPKFVFGQNLRNAAEIEAERLNDEGSFTNGDPVEIHVRLPGSKNPWVIFFVTAVVSVDYHASKQTGTGVAE